jgi:non-ribosomal peptide synthase protein (TIGR01720 family)
VLAVTMHHIVSDGWSIDVFLDELCRCYSASLEGRSAQLPPLAVQYLDFAAWQRQRFSAGMLAPQLEFWRHALAGAPTLLELPTDRPRPEAQSYQGAVHSLSIDATLATQVSDRARESGVTSFMTLLAAFGMALNRWSGQDDMVIGFPAAGRSRRELEPLIGMFVNTVPIRLQIAEGATFESLLAQVKACTVDALSNQDVPFEKLVDELGVERSLSWSPVFQVMFISQQARPAPALPAGLQVETIPGTETGTTKFDLTLAIAEREDGLAVSLEYDTALFDAATIERFANDYVATLQEGITQPNAALEVLGGSGSVLVVRGGSGKALPEPSRTPQNRPEPSAPATPAEQALADIWRQVLRLDRVSVTDNFFEVGGDSIVSIQVIAQLRDKGWKVDPRQIFRHQTIRALAAVAEPVNAMSAAVEETAGPLPITPMQRLFFDLNPPSPDHFNQSLLVTVAPDVAVPELQSALLEMQRVHPVLRSRFRSGANGWEQIVLPMPNVVLEMAPQKEGPYEAHVEAVCQAAQRSLDIVSGPVFRAVLIDCGAAGLRLFLVAHHLVVDAVSWRVILGDIETAYAQARRGLSPSLPGELCGPAAHRELVRGWHADAGASETSYWDAVTAGVEPLFAPRVSNAAPSSARTIVRTLAADEAAPLLGAAHRAYNTTTGDLLLAAYAKALAVVAGRDTILIDVEGHGRDALPSADLSRSVGWFTTLYPIRVAQVGTSDASTLIRGVKEANRSVPNGGLGFGVSRQSTTGGNAPLTDVSFNFLGQTGASLGDGLFRSLAPEPSGDPVAPDLPRRYRVELNASIVEGRLVTQYGFDASVVPEARIQEVADRVIATLRDLIEHCLGVEGQRYTPSDFAAVPIEQKDLDSLLSDLDLSGLSEA